MLLAIDVGNTNVVFGVYNGKKLLRMWRISSGAERTVDEYEVIIRGLLSESGLNGRSVNAMISCSVVPRIMPMLKGALKRIFKVAPCNVGEDVGVPIKNLYNDPRQVGQDRLVDAYAAKIKYGVPAIVVDYGTAITFDVISKRGEYTGGLIVPGIEISLEALSSRAALLPRIELTKPKELLGRDTINSMRSGILFGYGALTDGLVKKLCKTYVKDSNVIATGGNAELVATYCTTIDYIDSNLTLDGLSYIYNTIRKKS